MSSDTWRSCPLASSSAHSLLPWPCTGHSPPLKLSGSSPVYRWCQRMDALLCPAWPGAWGKQGSEERMDRGICTERPGLARTMPARQSYASCSSTRAPQHVYCEGSLVSGGCLCGEAISGCKSLGERKLPSTLPVHSVSVCREP